MPDVTGKRLDVAKDDIKAAGFEDKVKVLGGGVFGVLKDSNWEVCQQTPPAGKPLTDTPRLTIERDCNKDNPTPSEAPTPEESVSPSPRPSPSSIASPPAKAATKISVDALLDRLNAPNKGGIKLGDRFLAIGGLFHSELWMTGATGEYWVLLKAKGGNDDLPFFVDQAKTRGWRDGTRVELVLRIEERTINGETSDDWLNAVSVKTLG